MPLPSTRVVHPLWAAHHRPAAESAQTATCTIRLPFVGGGDWDPLVGPMTSFDPPPEPIYIGQCEVQFRNSVSRRDDAVDQPTFTHPYLVSLPYAAGEVPVRARVHIDACPDDDQLAGLTLTVADVQVESHTWDRILGCDLDLTNQPTPEV